MKKYLFCCMTFCALFIIGTMVAYADESSKGYGIKDITIATGPSGGSHEIIGTAVSEILRKNIEGVNFSPVPSNGVGVNSLLVANGECQMGTMTSTSGADAYNGLPPFKEKVTNIRAIFGLFPEVLQIWVPEDSSIKSLGDLIDKKFCFGIPSSSHFEAVKNLLELYGINETTLDANGGKSLALQWSNAVTSLRDGNIDALIWSTGAPAPAIQGIEISKKYSLLNIEEDKLQEFTAKYAGWAKYIVPKLTYKGQPNDVTTIYSKAYLIVDEGMDEKLVYNMVKALWENKGALGNAYAALKDINIDNVAVDFAIPIHPGAEKFFKEIGATIR